MSKVIVYSKPNCMQCNFTKKFLTENEVLFETKDVEESAQALQEVKDLGFLSLPVVLAEGHEPFNGFRPDKLKKIIGE